MATSTLADALPIGEVMRSRRRAIGEGEFAILTDLTWMASPPHVDREFIAGRAAADRELAWPVVVRLVASLAALGGSNHRLHECGIRALAAMGVQADFLGPVNPGDTLWAEAEFTGVRDSSSRPGQAISSMGDHGVNQRGEVVVELTRTLLVAALDAPSACAPQDRGQS